MALPHSPSLPRQVMSPPFRFLDEFDVFMDALNRRLAVEQIRGHALSSRRHQYVLLTPLALDLDLAGDGARDTRYY